MNRANTYLVDRHSLQYFFYNLQPNTAYRVTVEPRTETGFGPGQAQTFRTKPGEIPTRYKDDDLWGYDLQTIRF